ncbi:putative B3 domain-containing protein At1g78640 [Castanea sativa]|uniref:putative B3 domain-containing protein At1g78640 n=1 Tax=Castanea sativa TaxID=21020 RepID=UPI003F65017D
MSEGELKDRNSEGTLRTQHQMDLNQWKINRVLVKPDVALDRMFKFTRAEVEHIFQNLDAEKVQKAKGGQDVRVKMVDFDTGTEHELLLRKVRHGDVYGFKLGWLTHFVVRMRLKVGEGIGMFVDQNSSKFYFSTLSRAER